MSVILQPCGNAGARQHYADTIAEPVLLEKHVDLLGSIAPELKKLFPDGKAAIWGVTPGANGQNERRFGRAVPGDVVLFSRDGGIIAVAVLALKFHSAKLANRLWGEDDQGQTWEFIYFLDEVKPLKISYAEFNTAVGYQPNFIIQGFSVLNEEKSDRVLEHFGFISGKHQPPTTPEEYRKTVDQLANMEETERTVQSLARKEQSYLRRRLFNTTTQKCAMCGKEYPIDILVAAHIKRRSACKKEEKLDAENIVMAVCKIGCDELYESGYITVDDTGKILITEQKTTPALKGILEGVKGRLCSAFKSSNAKYFTWHKQTIFKGD